MIAVSCDKIRAENLTIIDCDESCEAKKLAAEKDKKKKDEEQRLLEEERNKEELLMYEKKFGRKKYKERKVRVAEEKDDNTFKKIALISTIAVLTAVLMYFLFWN